MKIREGSEDVICEKQRGFRREIICVSRVCCETGMKSFWQKKKCFGVLWT